MQAFTDYMEKSLQFEISNWPKWNLHRIEFQFSWTHASANNEVTLHQIEISNQFEFTSGLIQTCSKSRFFNTRSEMGAEHASSLPNIRPLWKSFEHIRYLLLGLYSSLYLTIYT